jgi:hypothetical protein
VIRRGTSIVVGSVCAALAVAGCGSSEEFESETLTFDSPSIEIQVNDQPPKDASRGDARAFTSPLLDEEGEEVGRLDGTVLVTDVGGQDGEQVEHRAGTIQFTLDGGTIVAAGVYVAPVGETYPAEGGVSRPIVGGTGDYLNARGQVTQSPTDDGGYRSVLELEVPSE